MRELLIVELHLRRTEHFEKFKNINLLEHRFNWPPLNKMLRGS